MPWFFVDDGFPDCPKLADIPERRLMSAVGLWTLAGAWSRKKLTGGFVPGGQVRRLGGTAEEAKALVDCGLWELAENGYRFHDWNEWQETAEEVAQKRENERAKKQAWRRRKKGVSPPCPPGTSRGHRGDSPPCPDGVPGDPSPSPSPSPLASLEEGSKRHGKANGESAKTHPSRLLAVLDEELRAEAFAREIKPTPTAAPGQLQAAAGRVHELVAVKLFSEPRAAARALVCAALDLVRDHKRPFGLALLDATIEPPKPEFRDNVLPWGRV